MSARKDPYRYFRIEAQELLEGLGQGLLQLETSTDEELKKLLLRHAHTLKGAARVVKRSDIGDLAHRLEDLLAGARIDGAKAEPATVDEALGIVDQIRRLVASLDSTEETSDATESGDDEPSRQGAEAAGHALEGDQPSIRVAVSEMDRLLQAVAEAHNAAGALHGESARLDSLRSTARGVLSQLGDGTSPQANAVEPAMERLVEQIDGTHQSLRELTEQVVRELDELRALASELRLVPARVLTDELQRVVRDAARTLERQVQLFVSGEETHVDAHVLARLRAALGHVVRNSVAHGIEPSSERERLGKARSGRIELSIRRLGHRVSIECRDDGRGIDYAAVRRAAIEAGVVEARAGAALDEKALGQLLLQGGISTSHAVTGVSGRGVGLDAVRHEVQSLRGELTMTSEWGRGTSVEILVPISLSRLPTLAMYVDETELLVPLDSVRQALRIPGKEIERDASGERVVVGGKVLPFLPLRRALDARPSEAPNWQSALIIEAEGKRAAIGVDRLGTASSVVVRAVPDHARPQALVSGAVLDERNVVQLLLSPPQLVRAASLHSPVTTVQTTKKKQSILVVDDSLTSRMLEQSILESAGYDVGLAVNGQEGLNEARKKRYALFIVDVEMPKMNGFEFISTIRADPDLRDTPAILVTSRADPEDKRRGKEAGARAYIVKSEFDQTVLLETIRRLVG